MVTAVDVVEVRVCEAGNLAKIKKDVSWENSGNFFDCVDLEQALDDSVLSVYATDSSTGQVVGFLALEVSPSQEDVVENAPRREWIEGEMKTLGYSKGSTLWVNVACLCRKGGDVPLRSMLAFAFNKFAHVDSIAMAVVDRDYLPNKAIGVGIPKISKNLELKVNLSCVERSTICPKLVVRPAKVEDHDDLVPVVEEMKAKFPDLSQLPDSVKPGEKFALARLIENDSWSVLVATVKDKIVGMMCLQEVEDLQYYQENFDLEMFDDLAEVIEAEPQQAEPKEAEAATEGADGGEAGEASPEGEGEGEGAEEGQEGSAQGEASPAKEGSEEEKAEAQGAEGGTEEDQEAAQEANEEDEDFDFTGDEEDGEEENANVEEDGEAAPEAKRESLAFAVKMFCMKDEYANQAMDFLQPAFDSFPNKDYCIVSLSHNSRVPDLLSSFSQATAATEKLSSDVLYVLHRYSLLTDFQTDKAEAGDYNEILDLLGELAEDKSMLESINKALDTGNLIKATCQGQIVGVCSVEPKVNLAELMTNFQLSAFSETLKYRNYNLGELTTFVMNPVFSYQKKFFLSNVMRLVSKTSLCFLLREGKPVADILDVFYPIQRRTGKGNGETDYLLFSLNQRDVYKEKDPLNARVIVVGASKCGLSCLESLLQNPQYHFTNMTMVTADQAVTKLAGEHAFLSQVRLISCSVVEINREEKQVFLEDDTVLSYDILVLTSGVQDQLDFGMGEEALPVVTAAGLKDYLKSSESKPEHAIVYGGRGEAFDAMSALDDEGVEYTYASPETSLKSVLVERIAAEVEIDKFLRKPTRMTLHSVSAGSDKSLGCSFVNMDGSIVKTETSLLVLAHTQNVNSNIFGCLNDSSIVYDGRLVVNGSFCTTDEFIFGGGTMAKFSRLYGGLPVEMFNSEEVGKILAANITAKCEQANGTREHAKDLAEVPQFKEPVGFSYRLPHKGTSVTYISYPPLSNTTVAVPEGGRLLRTTKDGQLSILGIDKNDVVCTLCFCGPHHADVDKMKGLMGLHTNYLGKRNKELDKIPCIYSYLTETWSAALYSEQVQQLRRLILTQGLPKTQSGLRSSIHNGVLELVKENIQDFTNYHLPYTDSYY
ncbi:flagellar associated protein [Chloropicon primus]|uniref:Flagellar associated protein n=1 Tax=Chloropicon primus TaxID=1764295 RepID=A0A5B8MJE5_9CHLO|nr:flagellar associated protein [Chloropicon primus]UPQ98721.1 flagellar associated protein [Chloropicon primus]|eukprot:QDZ19510.1 flagellar associated protein [Chloropicon primus]